jgi:cysteine desulfurase
MPDESQSRPLKLPIYMDNHSTTPVDPRVFEAMAPWFTEKFGNASSRSHSFGWEAAEAVKRARKEVAALIGADSKEIVFTSGATESDNLAIKGVAQALRSRGNHIITAATEHPAVLDSCKRLQQQGFEVTYLPVDRYGRVTADDVQRAHRAQTILVSIMLANNEVGTLQPIAEIGQIAREHGSVFHTDAVQAAGKIPIDVHDLNVDLLSLSAHKMYGPKGVGALYVRRDKKAATKAGSESMLAPLIDGGGHEGGLRSGTLNVPGIAGFGTACRIASEEMPRESERLQRLRDHLESGLRSALDAIEVNGHPTERLPNNLNVSFAYVDGEALLVGLNDVAVSTGAACTSAKLEPSHVLRAMGVSNELAQGSLRFGLGRFNTEDEVDYVIERVIETVKALRALREVSPGRRGISTHT